MDQPCGGNGPAWNTNLDGWLLHPMTDPWDERYIYLHMLVDFYGFHVGKYTQATMDLMGKMVVDFYPGNFRQ